LFSSCRHDKNNDFFSNSGITKETLRTEIAEEKSATPPQADEVWILRSESNEHLDTEAVGDRPILESLEIDPLEIFLGKWFLLDFEDNIDKSNSYIEIYPEGVGYKFDFNYYNDINSGYVEFETEEKTALNKDNGHVVYIVGQPFEKDDTLVFLVDSEGPLGFFQRE
jgi:hypothetical protein